MDAKVGSQAGLCIPLTLRWLSARQRDGWQAGVILGFGEHARCGVPMTLISFTAAVAWFACRPLVFP